MKTQTNTTHKRLNQKRLDNHQLRSCSGLSLVEILVSLVIGSIISLAMTDLFSKVLRVSNATQNEIYANAIANELIENTKQARFDYLNANQGTYAAMLVNRDSTGQISYPIRDEPLQLDFATKTWQPKTNLGKFKGSATLTIEPMTGLNGALKVTIVVNWSDTERYGSTTNPVGRSLKSSTIVMQSGTNYYTL
ncbi:MAG: hypothetical protein C0508_15130 [Cyanobacteria bacterium PR.023]|nr:hypothetical protein [Cyanobacteria bacterium PR.023]